MQMRVCWLGCVLFLLTACLPRPQTPDPQPAVSFIPTPTPSNRYTVTAWVNYPEPNPGQNVILSGNVSKNGVILGGLMMEGIWLQPGDEKPTLHCYSLVNYQRGRCNILVKDFPLDVYVPLTINIDVDGLTFTAETGFTPRGK